MAIKPKDKQVATLLQAEVVAEIDEIADRFDVSRAEVIRLGVLAIIKKVKDTNRLVQEEGEE